MVVVVSGMPDSSWCPGGRTEEGKRVNEDRKGGGKEEERRRKGGGKEEERRRKGVRKERRE